MRRALPTVAIWFIILSCGVARKQAEPSRADIEAHLADQVWAFAQDRPEGFTLDLATMAEPSEGVAVAYGETKGSNTRGSIPSVVRHALSHDGCVGGWKDGGEYWFDSVRLFPEDSLAAALLFARANAQKAVYVLSSGKEITVQAGRPLDEFAPDRLIVMYDESVGKEPLRKAVREYGAEIIYDYSIIPGMAIRIPEGKDIVEAMSFFRGVRGVASVERDRIYHLVEPVRPRLEVM